MCSLPFWPGFSMSRPKYAGTTCCEFVSNRPEPVLANQLCLLPFCSGFSTAGPGHTSTACCQLVSPSVEYANDVEDFIAELAMHSWQYRGSSGSPRNNDDCGRARIQHVSSVACSCPCDCLRRGSLGPVDWDFSTICARCECRCSACAHGFAYRWSSAWLLCCTRVLCCAMRVRVCVVTVVDPAS